MRSGQGGRIHILSHANEQTGREKRDLDAPRESCGNIFLLEVFL
jgi:hypothetical protein